MIKISDSFKTDDKKLAALYKGARSSLLGAVKPFGDYNLAVSSSESDRVTLFSEIMSAETLGRYDIEAAMDCVNAFGATQREDGRLASAVFKKKDGIFCDYKGLAGLCFAEEALSLFYMTKKKELIYLDKLYDMLERFDDYLWITHDANGNGYVELLDQTETVEGDFAPRYTPTEIFAGGKEKEVSPFPAELVGVSAFCYRLKKTLAEISSIIGNGRAEAYGEEAERIKKGIRSYFWNSGKSACYDRDFKGRAMETLTADNLAAMYYGALEQDMAEEFVKKHLLNEKEFYTPLPLPLLSVSDKAFVNDANVRWGGQVMGITYRQAVRAFEKYGFYSEFTCVAKRFLESVSHSMAFTEQYDPFDGSPSKEKICADYAPTASAVLEIIARFYGVSVVFDDVIWGGLGHEGDNFSEYEYKWGSDVYRLSAEKNTSTGFLNGKLLFTATNGVRVVTDWFGNKPRVINITDETLDAVFVYRDKTFSFTAEPGKCMEFKL
ncbi:MAG: hypothetical protein IJW79_00565 [Clostridia bacterium]|nr:hypothetical protein [Clostridia bacterium]